MTVPSQRHASASVRLTALIDAVAPDAWSAASPCEGWSARDVLDHVVSSELDFLRQRELPVPDVDGSDPISAWPVLRDTFASILADPETGPRRFDGYFGPTTIEETVDRFYTLDLVIHRWDIAVAVGLPEHARLTADEIDLVRANLDSIPDEVMRSPGLFGPAVEPPADADPTTELMAFLGRSV